MKTPRTDDAQWGTGKVTTDFARQLERETQELAAALREINTALSIPAAEYVPAIRDVFDIIDRVLARHAR